MAPPSTCQKWQIATGYSSKSSAEEAKAKQPKADHKMKKKSSTRSPEHFDDAVEVDSQPASPGVSSPSLNQIATESVAKAVARKALLSDPLMISACSPTIVTISVGSWFPTQKRTIWLDQDLARTLRFTGFQHIKVFKIGLPLPRPPFITGLVFCADEAVRTAASFGCQIKIATVLPDR